MFFFLHFFLDYICQMHALIGYSSVSWGCRIHQLHLSRGISLSPISVLEMILNYQMARLQPWEKWSTPSLPWLQGPLGPRVVAPDMIPSMGQIELWHLDKHYAGCNGYRHRKWTRQHKFKSWMRLIAFHIALIPLEKVWIQLFSLQLWVNSKSDWFLQPWWGN